MLDTAPTIFIVFLLFFLFVLGTYLIINGQRTDNIFKVIIGILMSGFLWGIIVYLIASNTSKNQQIKKEALDEDDEGDEDDEEKNSSD